MSSDPGSPPGPSRTLLLMRHAKSAWDSGAASDFDRPLARRGQKDAPRIGRWLLQRAQVPDRVLCSTSRRTRETLEGMSGILGLEPDAIEYCDGLYAAPAAIILDIIAEQSAAQRRLMVVAHNPGLDELLETLVSPPLPYTRKSKLMTTASVAQLSVDGEWKDLDSDRVTLVRLVRPREI